ncbi:MAG: TetR/AcrR family transcriptional regulator [Lysobacterales bacterium]
MAANNASKPRVSNAERRRLSTLSVLDSALHLFVTRGYATTSMDDVARHCGLTKGAVYFYFKDKLSLLDALLERSHTEMIAPVIEKLKSSNGSARDRIVLLTNWFARVGAEHKELPLLHVLVSLEMHGTGNKVEQHVRQTYVDLHQAITHVTEQGQTNGEFSRDISPHYQASVIVSIIDGLLLEWHRRGNQLDGRALARGARNMILNGIAMEKRPA